MSDIIELIEKLVMDTVRMVDGEKNPTSRIYTLKPLCDKIESRISAMQEVCDKVKEVYEKYKHLDELLSDKEFLDEKNIKAMILYDLWQAIKE